MLQFSKSIQDFQSVQARQHHLHHDHVRLQALRQPQQLRAVSCLTYDLDIRLIFHSCGKAIPKLFPRICKQDPSDPLHRTFPPLPNKIFPPIRSAPGHFD